MQCSFQNKGQGNTMSQLTFFEFERDRRQTLRLRRQPAYGRARRFRGMIAMGTIVTLIILGLILNVSEMVPLIASTLQRPVESSLVISLLAAVSYWCICRDSR